MIRRFAGWLLDLIALDGEPRSPRESWKCRIGWHHLRLIDTPDGYVFACTIPGCTLMPDRRSR